MWVAGAIVAGQQNVVDQFPLEDLGFAGLLAFVVWWLVRRVDRGDDNTNDEIARLRTQLAEERADHHAQIESVRSEHQQTFAAEQAAWRDEFTRMREWMNEQIEAERMLTQAKSAEKHEVVQRLTTSEGALQVIARLTVGCTCGAFEILEPVLVRWRDDPTSTG